MSDTLQQIIAAYRTSQAGITGAAGLLSKLKIGNVLYPIKDPAVEELASAIETRLEAVESGISGIVWDSVTKDANAAKFATKVEQDEHGAITVEYSGFTGLNDTAVAGQYVTSVSQDQNGEITVTRTGISGADVTFDVPAGSAFEATSTNVQLAIEDAMAKAMALKGTASDASGAETIAGAKAYTDAAVNALAGEDWTGVAHTVHQIIEEIEGSTSASQWATMVDKLAGMEYTPSGATEAVTATSVAEYVNAKIAEVNAASAEGIEGLDSVVYGAVGVPGSTGAQADTDYTGNTSSQVVVKVIEVDGKLSAVDVKTNDIASAQDLADLTTAYNSGASATAAALADLQSGISGLETTKLDKTDVATGTADKWTISYTSGTETLAWTNNEVTVLTPSA